MSKRSQSLDMSKRSQESLARLKSCRWILVTYLRSEEVRGPHSRCLHRLLDFLILIFTCSCNLANTSISLTLTSVFVIVLLTLQ